MLLAERDFRALRRIAWISAGLSVYVWLCLILTDHTLSAIAPNYPVSGGYILPVTIFFIAISGATFATYRFRWPAKVTFLLVPVSVFFPLVFFSVFVELQTDRAVVNASDLALSFCGIEDVLDCGPAFANLVMLRTMRAFVAVVTVPALCYFLHVHWLKTGLLNLSDNQDQRAIDELASSDVTSYDVSAAVIDAKVDAAFKESLLYLNLLVLTVLALNTGYLDVANGQIYAAIGGIALFAGACIKIRAKALPSQTRGTLVRGSTVFSEAILAGAFALNWSSSDQADAQTAMLIVIVVSFLTLPLVAQSFSSLLMSRLLLFTTCVVFFLASPLGARGGSGSLTEFFAPLFLLSLVNLVVGVWFYRTHFNHVKLRLETQVLQTKTANQNEELSQLLDKLSEEEKRGREQAEFREQLFRFLGHDLRQPINALSFMLFKLQREETDQNKLNSLKMARESVTSTNKMIEDVLDLSNARQNDLSVSKQAIRIQELFDLLEYEFSDRFSDQGASLAIVPSSAIALADAQLLLRALRNLLSNALKYAPGAACLMGVRRRKKHIDIQIIDSGPGIPTSDLSDIFKPFERGNAPQHVEGYGLGLAVTRDLIIAFGGEISVTSKVGFGSVFSVRLRSSCSDTQ